MPNWTRTIHLQPEWDQAKVGEISVSEMAGVIAQRLKRLAPLNDEDAEETRECLISDFEDMSRDPDLDADSFDDMMSNLYDWGDTRLDHQWNGKRVCWIDCTRTLADVPSPRGSAA